MATLTERLREAAARVLADGEVAFAYLFGSHAAGTATERSDIDIAVHLRASVELSDDEVLQLRLRLADELERAAGVGPIEVVVLDTAPLTLRGRVQENHTLP
ncbi:MAG: nucleotidyltransferase domain-containing protein [Actinobacteria bacterium]|nr:nucleotidyltransferase domain-containing protein [Actinomycetota bacterium]